MMKLVAQQVHLHLVRRLLSRLRDERRVMLHKVQELLIILGRGLAESSDGLSVTTWGSLIHFLHLVDVRLVSFL